VFEKLLRLECEGRNPALGDCLLDDAEIGNGHGIGGANIVIQLPLQPLGEEDLEPSTVGECLLQAPAQHHELSAREVGDGNILLFRDGAARHP
jgi:hypothetical protein